MTERELQEILRNNPDVKAPGFEQREPLTPAAKQWLAEERKKLEERSLRGGRQSADRNWNGSTPLRRADDFGRTSLTWRARC